MNSTKKKIKRLILSYAIIIAGQLFSAYILAYMIDPRSFNKMYWKNFFFISYNSIFIGSSILLLWSIFTGFIFAIIIIPLISFFKNSISKYIWILVIIGQIFVLKETSYDNISIQYILFIALFMPAFFSLFIAIYFQSKI